jgi:uncharacterized protein (TIGR00369 family)
LIVTAAIGSDCTLDRRDGIDHHQTVRRRLAGPVPLMAEQAPADDDVVALVNEGLRQSPLHRFLDLRVVRADDEVAVLEMPVHANAFGGTGNLHGGALATLIDVASAVAASRQSPFDHEQQSLVTTDLHVRYLGRPHGEVVRAEARVLRAGRQLVVVDCRVLDHDDRIVASADFSSMLVPRRQPLHPEAEGDPTGPEM